MKTRLINLIKVFVTLALLSAVAFTVSLRHVGQVLTSVRWGDLLVAIVAFQVGILARSYRWQALLGGQGVDVPLGRLLNLCYVGTFFNSFLPSGFGGDLVRTYELSRYLTSGKLAVSTVLMDRLMGLAVLFAMALVALPFSWKLVPASMMLALLAIIAGFALAIGLFLNRALVKWLASRIVPLGRVLANQPAAAFYDSFHNYTRASLVKSAVASLVFNITLIVVQVYLACAVGASVRIGYFFVFVPILSSLLAIPISISGFGLREGGYLLLFGGAGVSPDRSVAMSLLFYLLIMFTGLFGGPLYLWQSIRGLKLRTNPQDTQ